eukprot:14257019-Alexandrium_andersonii.AAC.1
MHDNAIAHARADVHPHVVCTHLLFRRYIGQMDLSWDCDALPKGSLDPPPPPKPEVPRCRQPRVAKATAPPRQPELWTIL